MIEASFLTDGKTISLSVKGHAGAAPKGFDLICASASMLTYTIGQVVKKMYAESSLCEEPGIFLKEGDSVIRAKPVAERYDECMHAFYVVQVGFELLAKSYPKYVKLNKFEQPF